MLRSTFLSMKFQQQPKVGAVQRFKYWFEDLISNRKKEIFFAGIATFALSQVAYREYVLRRRMSEQRDNTPQRQNRQMVDSGDRDGLPKAKWSMRKD